LISNEWFKEKAEGLYSLKGKGAFVQDDLDEVEELLSNEEDS